MVVKQRPKTFRCGLGRLLVFAADTCHIPYARHVADAGHSYNGLAEGCEARESQLAGFLEHIGRHDNGGNRRKADGEERESGDQLAHEVELRQDKDEQECPQPDAAFVVRAGLRVDVCLHDCPPDYLAAAPAWDDGWSRHFAFLLDNQESLSWMTVCTLSRFVPRNNARRVNYGWTGGEPGGRAEGKNAGGRICELSGE